MSVATKAVTGRRELHFNSYEEMLAEAKLLAKSEVTMLGNWSLGQILQHLAIAFNGSIDGLPFKVPVPIKIVARWFMKKQFLYGKLPSGFQIPEKQKGFFVANVATSKEEGLAALRKAVYRLQNELPRVAHPALGNLTNEE